MEPHRNLRAQGVMSIPRGLPLGFLGLAGLLLGLWLLWAPPVAMAQVRPYHTNPEHRGRVPACATCHSTHRSASKALIKAPTLDQICSACHRPSDIVRWKTADATFILGAQGDRILDHLSRVGPTPFDVQGPGAGPAAAP